MGKFIPDRPKELFESAPFFEDAKSLKIPGYSTRKSIQVLQNEVAAGLVKLGAIGVHFIDGTIDGKPKRYGYQVEFSVQGMPARITIAALPMRTETAIKKKDALEIALFIFRNRLEAEYWAAVYEPGKVPLLPYLLDASGQTVHEALMQSQILPMLTGGK